VLHPQRELKTQEWAAANGGYLEGSNKICTSTLSPNARAGLFVCVSYQPNDYITKYKEELRYCKQSTLTKAKNCYTLLWENDRADLTGLRQENLTAESGLGSLANNKNLLKGMKEKNNARFAKPDATNKCCWLRVQRNIKPGK
jgi:hypothetical protein